VKTKVWRAASTLASKLQGLGLIVIDGTGRERYETYYELSRLGRGCVNYLVERERSIRLRQAER
jgi:hypothetical protein